MEEGLRELDSILQLLDDVGMTWLTDEVRQLRFGGGAPSISSAWVAQSRQAYNGSRGESPFEPIESHPFQHVAERATPRVCIAFIAERIKAMAGQLDQAIQDAGALGIERIKFGIELDRGDRVDAAVELLRSLAESVEAEDLI